MSAKAEDSKRFLTYIVDFVAQIQSITCDLVHGHNSYADQTGHESDQSSQREKKRKEGDKSKQNGFKKENFLLQFFDKAKPSLAYWCLSNR